ncbi:EAL domain-containing protein [Jannaschia sp. R86511]|uniref:EAL domain-containing protein n=1 Tax=Jannaschia sp. R86511 TaxID=3093853 RepID=UPI0036D3766E
MTDTTDHDGNQAHSDAIVAGAAATMASQDAQAVARSAAETVVAAETASEAASAVLAQARRAASDVVAATASAAAETASLAATAVDERARTRAEDVAAAAVVARESVLARADGTVSPDEARRLAAEVAALVSADVRSQAALTAEAAARVEEAVRLAAEAAALAAGTAASLVEAAAVGAHGRALGATHASVATEAASVVASGSARRVAELARRRVDSLRHGPLVTELRLAVAREELTLHHQAMVAVDGGAVVGAEALLRWQHPTRGLLLPRDFLVAAEGPHLLELVGDWVVDAACAQAEAWQRELGADTPVVWVNVSCDQLGRGHLVDVVADRLAAHGVPASLLGLEVTERQLARRVDDVADELRALRRLGVGLAVDDFGTGYASLDYRRRFTFDEIKIDQCFVSGLQEPTDRAVASSVVALGHSLGLTVVAEGVETAQQQAMVTDLGVDISQGYLHHRPGVAAEVVALVRG